MLFINTLAVLLINTAFANNIQFLMRPTGKYTVGYQNLFITNPNLCPDKLYQKGINESSFTNSKHCHEIILQTYYPSEQKIKSGDKYYQPYLLELNKLLTKAESLSELEQQILTTNLEVHTYTKSNLDPMMGKKFPVVLFLSGSGQSSFTYNNIISNLVSHGYIVIGINSVFNNGPLQLENGKVVSWLESYNDNARLENLDDFAFIKNNLQYIFDETNLAEIIDYDRLSVIGHSLGAMNLIDYGKQYSNSNIKATILLDPGSMQTYAAKQRGEGFIFSTPKSSTLLMWSSNFRTNMPGVMKLKESDFEVVLSPNLLMESNFSNHENFSDYSTLQYHPSFNQSKILTNLNVGYGDGYKITKTISDYILDFLNYNLYDEKMKFIQCDISNNYSIVKCGAK